MHNAGFLQRIQALKTEHPFWGYRRIWAHLKFVDRLPVNKKRILRIMQEADLLVKPNLRLKAKRTSTRPKPVPIAPNQWWGIDMTKILAESFGWVYLVIVLDWYTKIVGYHAGLQSTARHWLLAVDMAANQQLLAEALETWIGQYNAEYLHSALSYKSPIQCESSFNNSHQTQFLPA